MTIRFNWGTGIALTYTAFALATSAFVAFAMERHVDLVSPDYYARSLQLDRRMEAVRNAAALGQRLTVAQTAPRAVALALPADQSADAKGTVTLYRASDASADRQMPIALDPSGRQEISLAGLLTGHWLVQVEWRARGRDYFVEREVIVQ
ncbi:MAG TPA: FixH family protein [Vicinamibacterales bacterium]|nr:FixH family protein [Vicinamibacterales bacterium]